MHLAPDEVRQDAAPQKPEALRHPSTSFPSGTEGKVLSAPGVLQEAPEVYYYLLYFCGAEVQVVVGAAAEPLPFALS